MFVTILSNIPLWVFPLFLGLLLLGMRATRDRTIPVLLFYGLPLLGLLSLGRARGLPEAEVALIALAIGFGIGGILGYALQGRWLVSRSVKRAEVKGEWLTMICLMGLFIGNFAVGMASGIAPEVAGSAGFAGSFGLVAGLLSGLFAGRAMRVALAPVG